MSAAAAPYGTLHDLLAVVVLAAVLAIPGLALLHTPERRTLLPHDGVDEVAGGAH